MSWTATTYLTYLAITVPVTIAVASTLSRNGRIFLADVFEGKDALARAVNTLLVVGFYLMNLGFVLLFMRTDAFVTDLGSLLETVSVKVGVVLLLLGVLHLFNILVFNGIRRRGHAEKLAASRPPFPPHPQPYPHPGMAPAGMPRR